MGKGIYPPSVQPGIPRLDKTPDGWKKVTFGDILTDIQRPVKLVDNKEYQLVVAKRSRGGIEPRERLTGKKILTKTQFEIRTQDFLISNRQIVHGACGIVPANLDGAVVSNEYSVLHSKSDLDLVFLNHFTNGIFFQQTCFHASVGVDVEKMIFRIDEWFKRELNLPPLAEQKKIAEILSTWEKAIDTNLKYIEVIKLKKKAFLNQLFSEKNADELKPFLDIAGLSKAKFDPKRNSDSPRCVELEHLDSETGSLLGFYDGKNLGSTKNVFAKGEVLFGKLRPYLKKFWLAEWSGVCSSEIWVLRSINDGFTNRALFYLCQTEAFNRAANKTSGTKMPRSDFSLLASESFFLPSEAVIEDGCDILESYDKVISLSKRLSLALVAQKKGLMQKLLTGKVRVKV